VISETFNTKLTAQDKAKINLRLLFELTERTKSSAVGGLFLYAFILGICLYSKVWTNLFYISTALIVLGNFIRLLLILKYKKETSNNSDLSLTQYSLFRNAHFATILATAFGWMTAGSWVFYNLEISSLPFQVTMLILAGVVSSALISLGAYYSLSLFFMGLLLFVPGFFLGFRHYGKIEMVLPILFFAYYVFLSKQAKIYFRSLIKSLQNQLKIEHSHELTRAAFDAFPGFVSYSDNSGQVILANSSLRHFLNEDEEKNKILWSDIIRQHSSDLAISVKQRCELEIAGEKHMHMVSSRKPKNQSGHMICVALDVQNEHALEQQAEAQRAMMEYSSRMASLGEMAAGVAHEINNPLAIIHGKVSILLRNASESTISSENLTTELLKIRQTSERIAQIIKGLRTFSRNGEKDPFSECNLSEIITDVKNLCAERMKVHNVDLRIPVIPDIFISCRAVQIEQVLMNLLNNAFDAIKNLDDKWIELQIVNTRKGHVTIMVIDSGTGIPKDIATKIMQPFFTTKQVGQGTGLGLSISKGIIEEHGGTLHYFPGFGNTCFVIDLPEAISKKKSA